MINNIVKFKYLFTRSIWDVAHFCVSSETRGLRQHADPENPLQREEASGQGAVPRVSMEATLGPQGRWQFAWRGFAFEIESGSQTFSE